MKISTHNAKRLITRFENAVGDYVFRGTIPAGESEEAAAAYAQVVRNYELAKKALTSFCIEAVVGEPQPQRQEGKAPK